MEKSKHVFSSPSALGLQRAIELVSAPIGKTFFYRNEHKRIINHGWRDEHRCRNIRGPLLYAITDRAGVVRYFGKWVSETPLDSRWYRHGHIHHQTTTRNRILEVLDAGDGPLHVWAASAKEMRATLPGAPATLSDVDLIEGLEALAIGKWRGQLWNKQHPEPPLDFPSSVFNFG
jgi:hypothetical protein